MGWYVRGVIIANLIILGFMWLVSYIEKAEGTESFQSMDDAFLVIGTFVRAVFIVFGAVLIAKLVISEYKNKTIQVMFTYPISRKKLLAAKQHLRRADVYHYFSLKCVRSSRFLYAEFDLPCHSGRIERRCHFSAFGKNGGFRFWRRWHQFSSHLFGMRKHSVSATIISSVVIVMLMSSTSPGLSISSIVYIPLSLAAVGLFFHTWQSGKQTGKMLKYGVETTC